MEKKNKFSSALSTVCIIMLQIKGDILQVWITLTLDVNKELLV